MLRFGVLLIIGGVAIACAVGLRGAPQSTQPESSRDHVTWVAQALTRMQTIKPGMTREALLKVFTTEGGISTGLQRRFVSRECLYFKVDVEFKAVGRPDRDREGRVTLVEDGRDIIVKISQPYLQFAIFD